MNKDCVDCENCVDCKTCVDCVNCIDCFACINTNDKVHECYWIDDVKYDVNGFYKKLYRIKRLKEKV